MNWLDICALDEINPLGSRIIAGPKAISRYSAPRTIRSSPSTIAARTGRAAVAGIVYGKRVACPLHNWQIDLASGGAGPGRRLRPSSRGARRERACTAFAEPTQGMRGLNTRN